MTYEIGKLPLQELLPAVGQAEDRLARLDERVRRSSVGPGFAERLHFFDAAASMWAAGELVHIEDLVLHDARMDIRTPTHELTISHAILRARRRIADADRSWAISESGIAALAGIAGREDHEVEKGPPEGGDEGVDPWLSDNDDLSREFAEIDAIIERSRQTLEGRGQQRTVAAPRQSVTVGDLVIRDAEWDERSRLDQWRSLIHDVDNLPVSLGAALLWDAWNVLEPLQNKHWLGALLISSFLRSRSKVTSHLFALNVGLKTIPRERRRSPSTTTRLVACLDAMTAGSDSGVKEVDRLQQAKGMMERRLRGRRSSSSLPAVIELVLSTPIVSSSLIAKSAKVTPRAALTLINELGIREITGRGRYRAWGVL